MHTLAGSAEEVETDLEAEAGSAEEGLEAGTGSVVEAEAPVSTRKQLPDLQTQIEALKDKYPNHVVFSDCASGLNFKRRGLSAILQLAFEKRLRVVRVAHKDRLCRFAYDLIEQILRVHGAKIEVESDDIHSAEQELTEDVIAVITVFGARLYGSRSGRTRKEKAKNGSDRGGASGDDTGADKAEDAIQEGGGTRRTYPDLQDENAPNFKAGYGTEAVLLGGAEGIQLGERPRKRRKSEKHHQAPDGMA
jgi:predicted site-specific integrase-resolvase